MPSVCLMTTLSGMSVSAWMVTKVMASSAHLKMNAAVLWIVTLMLSVCTKVKVNVTSVSVMMVMKEMDAPVSPWERQAVISSTIVMPMQNAYMIRMLWLTVVSAVMALKEMASSVLQFRLDVTLFTTVVTMQNVCMTGQLKVTAATVERASKVMASFVSHQGRVNQTLQCAIPRLLVCLIDRLHLVSHVDVVLALLVMDILAKRHQITRKICYSSTKDYLSFECLLIYDLEVAYLSTWIPL